MKAALIFVGRLLFVSCYSIAMGLLTGWIGMKIYEKWAERYLRKVSAMNSANAEQTAA
jgi:hypothetical protein